ncbi:MAG: hypothetical protein H5U04_08290 [Firmicutes bacterium]|nr:hypothetical protein [Bacillota bacterium]
MVEVANAPEVRLRGSREPVAGKTVAAIAAALATFLEAEAAAGRAFRIVDVRRYEAPPGASPAAPVAAWGLAGRLELMAARTGMFTRRATRQGVEAR